MWVSVSLSNFSLEALLILCVFFPKKQQKELFHLLSSYSYSTKTPINLCTGHMTAHNTWPPKLMLRRRGLLMCKSLPSSQMLQGQVFDSTHAMCLAAPRYQVLYSTGIRQLQALDKHRPICWPEHLYHHPPSSIAMALACQGPGTAVHCLGSYCWLQHPPVVAYYTSQANWMNTVYLLEYFLLS